VIGQSNLIANGFELRVIDTHTHAGLNWFEPIEMLIRQMELNSVSNAVLIQHGLPEYGNYDHSYLFDCISKYPGKFNVVGIVDPKSNDAVGDVERLKYEGAVGIRLNMKTHSLYKEPLALWSKIGELGMIVSMMGTVDDFGSKEFMSLVGRYQDIPIVIEHLAGGGEKAGFLLNGQGPSSGYEKFHRAMKISSYENVYIKVPGIAEISNRPDVLNATYDLKFYDEIPTLFEIAKDYFGVERMMWGSDYPPVSGREGYMNALLGTKMHPCFHNEVELEHILSRTALKVFDFE